MAISDSAIVLAPQPIRNTVPSRLKVALSISGNEARWLSKSLNPNRSQSRRIRQRGRASYFAWDITHGNNFRFCLRSSIQSTARAGRKTRPNAPNRAVRTVLRPDDVLSIAAKLEEPYATLVLFLAVTGLRVGEAVAIKWSDFDGDVLRISRRIYEGKIDEPKTKSSARDLPIPAMLLARLRALGGDEWIFRPTNGSPVNPGNALKRYVRPAVRGLNLSIGGWHDFRHTLATSLRRRGYSSKVVAEIVGHSSVRTTEQIYVHADDSDFRSALGEISDELFRDVPKSTAVN